jgi:hypothetical protein
MKQFVKIAVLLAVVAAVLFGVYHQMRAQGEGPKSIVAAAAPLAEDQTSLIATPGIRHTLLATYINQSPVGVFGTETGTVFQPVDNLTSIECPRPTGCTLEVIQNIQVGGSTDVGNSWATILYVDGSVVSQGSTSLGDTLPDGNYSSATYIQSVPITQGTHTVRSWVVSAYGLTYGWYNFTYEVFTR